MKIAFIIEYFFPFDKGGSEWSTFYLAKSLVKSGHKVTIFTPNFGSAKTENLQGVKVQRFPIYKKFKQFDTIPGNFFFTNPIFVMWSTIFLTLYLKKEKFQIIHIQGKYSILPVRLANIFLGKPLIATVRDYQAICNYGICLMEGNKACDLLKYYLKDFRKYYQLYVNKKNFNSLIFNLLASIWGRSSSFVLKKSMAGIKVVVLSEIQQKIYQENGIGDVEFIYNSFEFEKPVFDKKQNIITYAGRLTPGKGVNLLTALISNLIKKYSNHQFIFVGEGFLKNKLKKIAKKHKRVKLLGNISHRDLLSLFSKSKVVLAPSVSPEPFGRVVLEAIAQVTPVLVGARNGLAEEVDGKWGLVTNLTKPDLLFKLNKLLEENDKYVEKIKNDYPIIKRKFSSEVISKYQKLYQQLAK